MIVRDCIYGSFKISSPLILQLINSAPLQRLKKISQLGPPDKYYHLKNYSRFEHSIGVMRLLQLLGASEEEQIAGLLHDVSHTAFSHVIDWVVGSGEVEDFQDNQHGEIINKSEISIILKQHGYRPEFFFHYKHFSLLEQDIPALCADRIDYALREFPKSIAKICVVNLVVDNKVIVFKNGSSAYLFAHHFLKRQMEHWGGYEAVTRYRLFAEILKIALKSKSLVLSELMGDEDCIVKKLESLDDLRIKKILYTLKNKDLSHLQRNPKAVHKKFRYVDPMFLDDGKVVRLSQVNKKFKIELQNARQENAKGIFAGIVK